MNDKLRDEMLVNALQKIKEAQSILEELVSGIATSKRVIFEIMKYISGSGNVTWRGECEDGTRVYFRQAQREYYQEIGLWDWLQELDTDSTYSVHIDIETIPDGDFQKVVVVNSWDFDQYQKTTNDPLE